MAPPSHQLLLVEHIGEVTLVKFRRHEILDVATIEDIGDQLFQLVREERRHRLLLNLRNVDRLSTSMVGKFVSAHRQAQEESGQLAFCHIEPGIYRVFEMLKLTRMFQIYENEQKGMEALAKV